jgi:hypothetical protein
MKNEFEIDSEVLKSYKENGDFFKMYGIADVFSKHALINFYYDKQLLKQAANKYYTCALLTERHYPKKNPQEVIDTFCSLFNYCYFFASSLLGKYYTYPPSNFDLATEYNSVAELYIDAAIMHEERIKESPLMKEYSDSKLLDFKRRKLVLQVDKWDDEASKSILIDDPKSSFIYLTNAVEEQKRVLHFVKENLDKYDVHLEEANLIGKELKLEASRAEIFISRVSKGLETEKDSYEEIVGSYLIMARKSNEAYNVNPNSDKFRDVYLDLKRKIKRLLEISKQYWFSYLVKFENEKELEYIMKEIDIEKYKLEKAKLEIKANPAKNLFLHGGFFLFLFLAVLASLVLVALLKMPVYSLLIAVIFSMAGYVLVVASIFRSTDTLSEEGFISVLEIALKFSMKGLKSFLNKKQDKES